MMRSEPIDGVATFVATGEGGIHYFPLSACMRIEGYHNETLTCRISGPQPVTRTVTVNLPNGANLAASTNGPAGTYKQLQGLSRPARDSVTFPTIGRPNTFFQVAP
jgi:hypothetical protein